jgi:5-dehydro-4-deoxyglucarate dehydratase
VQDDGILHDVDTAARDRLVDRIDGLLFFPVTPFAPLGGVDVDRLREHVRAGIDAGAGAVFVACGTGEFPSLDLDEYEICVDAAVREAAGAVPIVAGIGYGTTLALRCAERAAAAGADGVLAMPPYLVAAPQEGLRRHFEAIADGAGLDVILYQRANAILEPDTVVALARHPRIVGLKDGHGDLDHMQRTIGAVRMAGGDLRFFNGMPTAEMTALAYRGVGVTLYSSAVFCFAPQIALTFFRALRGGDDETAERLLDEFYRPYVELRRLSPGYAVSLVKAGVRLAGLDAGPVRAPLVDPPPEHVERLRELVARGHALVPA